MHTAVLGLALQGLALLSITIDPASSAGIPEFLNLNDVAGIPMAPEHVIATNSLREAFEDNSVGTPCHVEYVTKVTKREAGRCIKLGRGIQACATDTYLDPFHPECM